MIMKIIYNAIKINNIPYSLFSLKTMPVDFFCLFSKQKVNELLGREKLKFGEKKEEKLKHILFGR